MRAAILIGCLIIATAIDKEALQSILLPLCMITICFFVLDIVEFGSKISKK